MSSKLYQISDDTPIAMLTVGQLRSVLDSSLKERTVKPEETDITAPKRYVHGIVGIKNLFNVSYPTAYKMKQTILRPAISQQGRVILTDVDLALKIFKEHEKIESFRKLIEGMNGKR